MDVTASLAVPCGPEDLFAVVRDLSDYPAWLGLVARAAPTVAADVDPGPAWDIELRGRLGPLARSKRLRMVRSIHAAPSASTDGVGQVVFERRELDGRVHSTWRLVADISAVDEGAELVMHLHYGGGFGGHVLERILADEIEQSRPRLQARVLAGS